MNIYGADKYNIPMTGAINTTANDIYSVPK